jgi:SAM-dependent methyltransferase
MAVNSKELVNRSFSERAAEWSACYADGEERTLEQRNLLSRQRLALEMLDAAVLPPAKVLDAGCGSGEMAAKLIERGYDVEGVDIAEPMIRHAGSRFGSHRFHVADIEHIPFPDNTFDAVVCLGVLEYLEADTHALREIWRVLKPAGTAVFATPSSNSPLQRIDGVLFQLMVLVRPPYYFLKYRLRGRPIPSPPSRPEIAHRKYHLQRWLRMLRAHCFESDDWICHGWGWYRSPLGAFARSVSDVARALRLGNNFARNRALNWLAAEQIVRVRAIK